MLPRTSELLFLNLTTLEHVTYCIELTGKGWRIASNRADCMNGDFRQLHMHTKYFESLNQLLDTVSPSYRQRFGGQLIDKLKDLQEENNSEIISGLYGMVKFYVLFLLCAYVKKPGKMGDVRWRTLGLAAVLLAMMSAPVDSSFGAMSIDLGSQFLKVGIVKPGVPMEIVLNKESQRKTPNVLSIRNGERLFGDAAQGLAVRYPASVYGHLLDLVAKHIDHPSVKVFHQRFPHLAVEKHVNESSVVFPIGDTTYPVETLLAMILTNVREFTEAFAEMSIRDVVISVPAYFTQAERLVIEKAAEIAKLNLLQLLNDGTAAALNYGVFRRKEITEKPQRLLIYDMGAAKTIATLVEYKLGKAKYGKEPKLTVLGIGFDRTLGGLEMTLRLRDLLVTKFNEHYKTKKQITTSEKAMAKLFKEAERLKQVLSANMDHYAQVESVHEDVDMRVHVTREEFNKLIDDLMERVVSPVDQALKIAELTLDQVDQVVLMGAGTRVPRVQEELQKFIGGKELGRFLNTDEAIAMGALFQAAHLSKGFKVKPFGVEELIIFPVQVNFISKQKQENGEVIEKPITRQVFQLKSSYPTTKKTITFTSYTDDFSFDLNYSGLKHFTEQQVKEFDSLVSHLNKVSVSGVGKALEEKYKPDQTEFAGVKVAFQMDLSGIVRIEKAEAVIQRKSQGKNATSADATKEKGTIPEVSKVTLKIKQMYTTAHLMSKQDVAGAKKILEQFEKRERHARERAAAENELEGYAFEVSQLLEEEEYVKHSTEEERKKLTEQVKSIRNWLEDETTPDTKTSEFTKRHVALQTLLRPIKKRVEEGKTLAPALNNLESMLNSSRIMVKMGGDDEKSLFNKSDADAFGKKLDKLATWLTEKKEAQAKRQPHEDPALTTSEVAAKDNPNSNLADVVVLVVELVAASSTEVNTAVVPLVGMNRTGMRASSTVPKRRCCSRSPEGIDSLRGSCTEVDMCAELQGGTGSDMDGWAVFAGRLPLYFYLDWYQFQEKGNQSRPYLKLTLIKTSKTGLD
ncbi:DnaK family protein [Ancylostoma ceylanicum]|uniref:DnaK family protein n=1 Tax=Ancylostoma ceylanicum TaxID=53326 RepID=A0A0D6M4D9_9BILA|nr:DnaK family protein [Ancylostoma ceylanicum]